MDVRATSAAIEVLRAGGNAVDAAIAASAVIGVTDPYSCGIGGGGFMVIYRAGPRQVITVDPTFVEQTRRNVERFKLVDSTRRLYLTPEGQLPPLGSTFRNPDLARTYELLWTSSAAPGAQAGAGCWRT